MWRVAASSGVAPSPRLHTQNYFYSLNLTKTSSKVFVVIFSFTFILIGVFLMYTF